jgi:hypothetical protein
MSYGIDLNSMFIAKWALQEDLGRRQARRLPVQQPTKFELIVNLQ